MPFDQRFRGLLAAARDGREWAWEALYRELAPRLLGYLRANGATDPEDLLGEVLVQLVRDLPRFDGGEEQFRAWAFTVAHHRLLDDRRRRARRPVEDGSSAASERVGGDVAEEALARIGDQRVRLALARLSADQRAVLMLRLLGDLTVEQASRALGKTPGAVKALQRRALEVLRSEISRLTVTL